MRRGIVLAGGTGTRLFPLTGACCKQLLPVYDKPLIYYSLSVLMLADIRDILIITTPQDQPAFQRLLGDGSQWGLALSYAVQPEPHGIAQAFHVARDFVGSRPSALVLGDNIFYGQGFTEVLARANARTSGATIFAYYVSDPERYGVLAFDPSGAVQAIEEKPRAPQSNYAVTGLYFYDGRAVELADSLRPSARGEYEITDLNRRYLEGGALHVEFLSRGFAWLDTGTHQSLLDAALYAKVVEERQGLKVCCPEEIAWRMGFISADALARLAAPLRNSGYGEYLLRILEGRLYP
jgi:glucose-1-phosphate thymidylyltransferase